MYNELLAKVHGSQKEIYQKEHIYIKLYNEIKRTACLQHRRPQINDWGKVYFHNSNFADKAMLSENTTLWRFQIRLARQCSPGNTTW